MTVPFAHDSVVRIRASIITDRYGAKLRDWAGASRTTLEGWHVQPESMSEQETPDRNQATTRYRAFGPAGSDVVSTDRIEWSGETFSVDGLPERWPSPFGGEHHVELRLRLVEG